MPEKEFNKMKQEDEEFRLIDEKKRPYSAPVMESNVNPIASVWTKKALERAAANATVVKMI